MLDQNLPGRRSWRDRCLRRESCKSVTIQTDIDVTRARHFQFLDALDRANSSDNFFGDFTRRFAQSLGQLESQRQCIFAKVDAWRLLDHDASRFSAIGLAQEFLHLLGQPLCNETVHVILCI